MNHFRSMCLWGVLLSSGFAAAQDGGAVESVRMDFVVASALAVAHQDFLLHKAERGGLVGKYADYRIEIRREAEVVCILFNPPRYVRGGGAYYEVSVSDFRVLRSEFSK